ncbi:unnamed protein product, partial [Brenthis ino]
MSITKSLKQFNPLWINCDNIHSVCMQSKACKDRVIHDKDECLEYNKNFVCCRVAHIRMPVDMFDNYD